jgi:hypothetical protein
MTFVNCGDSIPEIEQARKSSLHAYTPKRRKYNAEALRTQRIRREEKKEAT